MSKGRRASHAGSWYRSNGKDLDKELTKWLADADSSHAPAKAIIAPHAGYSYSGPTAAHAYKQINPPAVTHIFLLGPSHHVHIAGCALTKHKLYNTPLYNINIDVETVKKLQKTGLFEWMDEQTDEDEHSLELHLPYIAKVMQGHTFQLVPILVGSLSMEQEKEYGSILTPYFSQANNLFIFSSDFCHWGSRFRYTYYDKKHGDIWKSIDNLDHLGMSLIEDQSHQNFHTYLKSTHNTICGRHPIAILLAILTELKGKMNGSIKFLKYTQSSKCYTSSDSSVSYASASFVLDSA